MKNLLSRVRKNRQLLINSTVRFLIHFGTSAFLGYLTARFFAGPQTYTPGRLPSIAFNINDYRVHLHHWLIFSAALLVSRYHNFFILKSKFFYGFSTGVIYQGIVYYDDWKQIITKQL